MALMEIKHKIQVLCAQIILIVLALLMFYGYFTFTFRVSISILATLSMISGFVCLASALLLEPFAYEKTTIRNMNISEENSNPAIVDVLNHEPTPQAIKLCEALKERGIPNELEQFDGHKHVDISIPWAKLNIEVDGKYHLTNPEHLFRDLQRDACSHNDGVDTIRIPNFYVENHLDEIANAVAEVARKRQGCGMPSKETQNVRYQARKY